jgi:hypothetical protein
LGVFIVSHFRLKSSEWVESGGHSGQQVARSLPKLGRLPLWHRNPRLQAVGSDKSFDFGNWRRPVRWIFVSRPAGTSCRVNNLPEGKTSKISLFRPVCPRKSGQASALLARGNRPDS